MKKKTVRKTKENSVMKSKCNTSCGCGGAIYGLGVIGSAVYYIVNATSFWMGLLGLLKALIWPAFLVHGLSGLLGL